MPLQSILATSTDFISTYALPYAFEAGILILSLGISAFISVVLVFILDTSFIDPEEPKPEPVKKLPTFSATKQNPFAALAIPGELKRKRTESVVQDTKCRKLIDLAFLQRSSIGVKRAPECDEVLSLDEAKKTRKLVDTRGMGLQKEGEAETVGDMGDFGGHEIADRELYEDVSEEELNILYSFFGRLGSR